MKLSPFSLYPKQFSLDFDNSSPEPVIWQWNELSISTKETILEISVFNSQAIKTLPRKEKLEPWIKCTLNGIMDLLSKGWVDLRFD